MNDDDFLDDDNNETSFEADEANEADDSLWASDDLNPLGCRKTWSKPRREKAVISATKRRYFEDLKDLLKLGYSIEDAKEIIDRANSSS